MKKIVALCTVFLMALALSACTKTTTSSTVNSQSPSNAQESDKSMTVTASGSATATFAPTNDEDIKAMDKTIDQVNFNDYSDKALDDLK